jgi:hypothetical protein
MLAPGLGFVRPMLLNSPTQLLFGARHIDLMVSSAVTCTTRQYRTDQDLDRDTINAGSGWASTSAQR